MQLRTGLRFADLLTAASILILTFVLFFFFLSLRWLDRNFLRERTPDLQKIGYAKWLLLFLILGILLTPTELLGGGFDFYDCGTGAIGQYRIAVNLISGFIESGDRVFWIGKDTQVVLLGMHDNKDFRIYPQQLNSIHSFRIGGNREELNKAGFWQKAQAQEWIDMSDLLLFEQQAVAGWFEDTYQQLDLSNFEKVAESNNIGCTYSHRIYIYRRLSP
jgi:hypothetical protein